MADDAICEGGIGRACGIEPTLTSNQVGDEVLLVIFELHAGHRTMPGELAGVIADELDDTRVNRRRSGWNAPSMSPSLT